jgi:hypothetical protein
MLSSSSPLYLTYSGPLSGGGDNGFSVQRGARRHIFPNQLSILCEACTPQEPNEQANVSAKTTPLLLAVPP